MAKIPKTENLEEAITYIQGLYYEQKIRASESKQIISTIEKSEAQRKQNIKNLEKVIQKLEGEINFFKKLAEKRNSRHKGFSKNDSRNGNENGNKFEDSENFENLDADSDSGIYDWIVDIDLISNVKPLLNLNSIDIKEGMGSNFLKKFYR